MLTSSHLRIVIPDTQNKERVVASVIESIPGSLSDITWIVPEKTNYDSSFSGIQIDSDTFLENNDFDIASCHLILSDSSFCNNSPLPVANIFQYLSSYQNKVRSLTVILGSPNKLAIETLPLIVSSIEYSKNTQFPLHLPRIVKNMKTYSGPSLCILTKLTKWLYDAQCIDWFPCTDKSPVANNNNLSQWLSLALITPANIYSV